MVPQSTGRLLDFKNFNSFSPIFIETGTCYGDGLQRAIDAGFTMLYSVEAHKPFYEHSKKRFRNIPDKIVKLYHGKSTDKLPEMLANAYRPAVIFLDAHPAGQGTAGHNELMKEGASSEYHQHTILTNELKHILNHSKNHLIIIDDQNGLNADNEEYIKMLLAANPAYKFLFMDEHLPGGKFYKDKSLVCIPS